MASKAISDYLSMPEDIQLMLLLAVQNGDLTVQGSDARVEEVASAYWSGKEGYGSGIASIFPFRRTDPSGNLYIIHKDVLLYLSLLFTGTNVEYLYDYKLVGIDGEYSQEMKDEVKRAVILKQTTVSLSGALKCEALSKTIRGYEELTPVQGIEVDAKNPLLGSAVFHISKRTFDRLTREEQASWQELAAMAALNTRRSNRQPA